VQIRADVFDAEVLLLRAQAKLAAQDQTSIEVLQAEVCFWNIPRALPDLQGCTSVGWAKSWLQCMQSDVENLKLNKPKPLMV
jgi:hypothetical protein